MQLRDEEWEFIGPCLPIGEHGPYPERLRQQFDGVSWRFKTGGQWREIPQEFGAWSTVSNRFRQCRDAGVFEALLEGLIAEAAKQGKVDLSLVSIDSTTARAHHDAAGIHLGEDVLTTLEKAAAEEEKARSKGAASKNQTGTPRCSRKSASASPLAALAPNPMRSLGTGTTRPAATEPTCVNATSRRSSRRSGTRPPTARSRAPVVASPSLHKTPPRRAPGVETLPGLVDR